MEGIFRDHIEVCTWHFSRGTEGNRDNIHIVVTAEIKNRYMRIQVIHIVSWLDSLEIQLS